MQQEKSSPFSLLCSRRPLAPGPVVRDPLPPSVVPRSQTKSDQVRPLKNQMTRTPHPKITKRTQTQTAKPPLKSTPPSPEPCSRWQNQPQWLADGHRANPAAGLSTAAATISP